MRKLTALVICACIAISAVFAQTRQQALDEIARIEKDARNTQAGVGSGDNTYRYRYRYALRQDNGKV